MQSTSQLSFSFGLLFFNKTFQKKLSEASGPLRFVLSVKASIFFLKFSFRYAYYGISALGPKYQKYLWWKKYMTWIQLGQFMIMLVYLVYISLFNCQKYRKGLNIFFLVNVIIFMYLFADFYRKAYIKKEKNKKTNWHLSAFVWHPKMSNKAVLHK